jgi:hypothetical protein
MTLAYDPSNQGDFESLGQGKTSYQPNLETTLARLIAEHRSECPFLSERISERLRATENRLYLLIGLMLGSGFIGGATAGVLQKMLTP